MSHPNNDLMHQGDVQLLCCIPTTLCCIPTTIFCIRGTFCCTPTTIVCIQERFCCIPTRIFCIQVTFVCIRETFCCSVASQQRSVASQQRSAASHQRFSASGERPGAGPHRNWFRHMQQRLILTQEARTPTSQQATKPEGGRRQGRSLQIYIYTYAKNNKTTQLELHCQPQRC